MQNETRLPRLLDGDFRERKRLRPTALSLSLERSACSTAQLTLPETEGPLPFLGFLELYTPRGSAGLFRVTADTDPVQGARTYPLRHAIDTLHDSLWKAQTDFSGTMAAFLSALLAQQNTPYWQLGQCQDSGSWKREGINYDRLDALLDEVREARRDYLFAYDFSTTPWTLNFVRGSETVDAEMRLTRNMLEGALRRTREGMGNRLYLSISTTARESDGSPGETTVEYRTYNDADSQAVYGPVEIAANVDSEEVADPDAWAAQFLREHALPIAQASADGWEIVKSTGEPWDQMDLGKRCRLAAKREGFPAEFPIERIQYENLFGDDPERVRVDMNRKLPRFSERLATAREKADRALSAARGAGARIKRNEEADAHWQRITRNTTQSMEDCFGVIGVKLDADHKPMTDDSGNYIWAGPNDPAAEIWGHLHRNAWTTQILNHIKDGDGKVLSLSEVYTDAYGNAIINAINDQRTGTATINANRVRISGAVTIDSVFGMDNGSLLVKPMAIFGDSGNLVTINNGKVSADTVQINSTGALKFGDGTGYGYRSIDSSTAGSLVTGFGNAAESGGQVSIPYYTVGVPQGGGASAGSINFNIAATQYYLDHVAAAYGNAVGRVVWPNTPRSQSSFSVSAPTNPWNAAQEIGTTESRVFALSNDGQFDANTHITTVNLEMSHSAGGQTVLDGVVATIAIDASAVYTEGQDAAPIQGQITKTYTSNGWKSVIYPDEGYSGISAVQIHVDVPIPEPPAYASSGWGITAAAGGGTKVELYVDGNHFSHTFENYP